MVPTFKTPGVYIKEISSLPPSIAPVETAVPAFIGYTETAEDQAGKDLTLNPTRISSMVEYETYFGKPQEEENIAVAIDKKVANHLTVSANATTTLEEIARSLHIMHYALQLYFANGGGPCYIVSVHPYKTDLGDPLVLDALKAGLDRLAKADEPTLIIFPEAQRLSMAEFKLLHDAALDQCARLRDRFVIMDLHGGSVSLSDPSADLLAAVTRFRSDGIGVNNLKYGAAYAPNLETTVGVAYNPATIDVTITTNGVAAAPVKLDTLKIADSDDYERARAAIRDHRFKMPPSSAIAGIYASVDARHGVWKAPANIRVSSVVNPAIQISSTEQKPINIDAHTGKSINAIRAFTGKGTLIWGARTLAGNDNEWRYINVRRFFNFVDESIKKAIEPFAFAPNDSDTWVGLKAMIENFLTDLWRQGALQGVKPEHAFYVAVGHGKTMTRLDIRQGRMIVEIGMAAVRSAEFIILNLYQKMRVS